MEGLEPIEETYRFKSHNVLNERINVIVHFQEHLMMLPIVKERYILYCTIFVKTARGRLQFYHGGTVWNGQDVFDRNDAAFKAFQDALVRRFAKECDENYLDIPNLKSAWEKYCDGWCKYFWEIMCGTEGMIKNGKIRETDHPSFF